MPRDVKSKNKSEEALFGERMPLREALEQLRIRLLDLTARNRLLNFKTGPGKTLQIVNVTIDDFFTKLVIKSQSATLAPIPAPAQSQWETQSGRLVRPDIKSHAIALGIDISLDLATSSKENGSAPHALYYPDDLERHLRKLSRDAKTAIEETGANILFLVVGLLEYPDRANSERLLNAPLIAVPVQLDRGELNSSTGHFRYSISYTGEDIEDNLSLREKLRADWSLELPEIDELEAAEPYLESVARIIKDKPGWKVKNQTMLALLSFNKMLLVKDLNESNWPLNESGKSTLLEHPLLNSILSGSSSEQADFERVDEYNIDEHPKGNIPLIYDCDSSQHSALIDALSGCNMVIHGPPGTGKSQTITNLIAASIAAGQKVLFVAEKLAALQVVKERLEMAGLGDFCLELHSNKANKKRVLEDLERRLTKQYAEPAGLSEQLRALESKKVELKRYVELLNSVVGNAQGLTVNQIMWRAERFRQELGVEWEAVQDLQIKRADELTDAEFCSITSILQQLSAEYESSKPVNPSHPFWGFYLTELAPGAEITIEKTLRVNLPKFILLATTEKDLTNFLGEASVALTRADAQKYLLSLANIEFPNQDIAFDFLSRFFSQDNSDQNLAVKAIKEFAENLALTKKIEAEIKIGLREGVKVEDIDLQSTSDKLNLLSGFGLADISLLELAKAADAIERAVGLGKSGLSVLMSLSEEPCMSFDGTRASLAQLEVVAEISKSAPEDLLHLRHEGLRRLDTEKIAVQCTHELLEIHRNHKELNKKMYMDMLPTFAEVGIAIQILRKGHEWWRIFQSSFRRAKGLHRALSRSAASPTSIDSLHDLEALYLFQTSCVKWESNPQYRAALGPLHAGMDTRAEDVRRLITWSATARKKLAEAGVAQKDFDHISVDEAILLRSNAKFDQCFSALADVQQAERILLEITRNSPRNAIGLNDQAPLTDIFKRYDSMAVSVREAFILMNIWGLQLASSAQILKSIKAQFAMPHALIKLEGDGKVKGLLGKRYQGAATDLVPVSAAFVFRRKLLNKSFPSAFNRLLLAEASEENLQQLVVHLQKIATGWAAVDELSTQMERFGRFDIEKWSGLKFTDAGFIQQVVLRATLAITETDKLFSWVQYTQAVSRANDNGLDEFTELLESSALSSANLATAFSYRFYATIIELLYNNHGRELAWFSGEKHQVVRKEFGILDVAIRKLRGKQCAASAAAKGRAVQGKTGTKVDEKTEMQLLTHLFPQVRPRMSIRKLVLRARQSIQALKPCFLMGPQAVAQFLDPKGIKFDLVIMDEASQLKPEDALGAAVRGAQLVVVGDPNQLPPTGFWDKLSKIAGDGAQQVAALELESILDICIAQFRPVRYLRWHYRSQHQSLIAFSNKRFYNGDLVVFPSPYEKSRRLGVQYCYINDAEYDNGRNEREAWRVTDAVIHHILKHPEESLGVVTLNLKQRDLIESILDERFKSIAESETYRARWADQGMDFFVKNLENVQGDERDVIFISTTFGKAPNTAVVAQHFGPISRADGWRRLNVLFTRAKRCIHVFSSMLPEDIISDPMTPRGTRELRAYLEYARSGILEDSSPTDNPPDSDFEVSVARALATAGYACVPQLGVAGYRIDIAVRHPRFAQAFLAAIECDGATYHSGRSVRDRDRIRQEIIESLGWKDRVWRIWSTDWFRQPGREMSRLLTWLKKLEMQPMDEALLIEDKVAIDATAETLTALPIKLLDLETNEAIDSEEIQISVGDTVTYAFDMRSGEETRVHISAGRSNLVEGMLWEGTPLAQTLLGATAGEEVVLRVPGQPPKKFVIKKIMRPRTALEF